MQNPLRTDEELALWVLLHVTRDAMFKARQRDLRELGISPRQAAVLVTIQTIGNEATPAELARWLFRESHSVSEIIERMEKQGLVRKVKDLARKNQVRVVLTERGQEVLRQSSGRKLIHRVISSLSEEERQQLRTCLGKLTARALLELGQTYKPHIPWLL